MPRNDETMPIQAIGAEHSYWSQGGQCWVITRRTAQGGVVQEVVRPGRED